MDGSIHAMDEVAAGDDKSGQDTGWMDIGSDMDPC